MTVKKYYPTISCDNAEMEEDADCGQWVSCDDYEALESECDELKTKLAEIEAQQPVAFHNGEYFFESGRKYYSLHVDRRLQDLPKGNLYAHPKLSQPIANNSEPAFEITDECGRPMTYWGGKVTANKAEVPEYVYELVEAIKNLMAWQVKNVDTFDNYAYNDAAKVLKKLPTLPPLKDGE